jgi:hypothetical protein
MWERDTTHNSNHKVETMMYPQSYVLFLQKHKSLRFDAMIDKESFVQRYT